VPAATGIKRLGLAVAALLVLGIGALLALSLAIPADSVREAVKSEIHAVTGLDPSIRGDVSVSLFPRGSVRFNDVSLGDNRTGASALTAEQLVVRLRFLPFLIGRVEIADVTLVRPTIMIAFASDGSSNWAGHIDTLARALQPSPDRGNSFSEIRIGDGTVIVRDEGYKIVETLRNVEFALAWPSISKSFAANGHFNWNDKPFDASISLTDFLAALTGDRSGLKVRLNGAPFKLAFDGNISQQPVLRMEGVLAADTASLRDALRWTAEHARGNGFQRFALKAQTRVTGRSISLTKVNVELDGNSGEGVLTFAADGRQSLQGTLAVESLDLTPYISTYRFLTSERNWSQLPIDLKSLNGLDADLRISAASVTIDDIKLGRTAVAANLRGGTLNIAIGEAQAFGGVIKGSVTVADNGAGAKLNGQLQLADIFLDQSLGVLIGVRRLEGKGNIDLNFEGSGSSIYDITQGLNGTVTLSSRKGAVVGVNVEQLLKRLERNPLAGRGGDFRGGKTPYDMMSINFKVTHGTATVEELRVDAPTVRIDLSGTSSIPGRNLDLKGTASLIADTAATFDLPFVVQGPWDDPLVWPDVQMLIRRSGAAQPLLDAMRNRLKRDASVAPAAPSPPAAREAGPQLAAPPPAQITPSPSAR
jgi:AsmA protein